MCVCVCLEKIQESGKYFLNFSDQFENRSLSWMKMKSLVLWVEIILIWLATAPIWMAANGQENEIQTLQRKVEELEKKMKKQVI